MKNPNINAVEKLPICNRRLRLVENIYKKKAIIELFKIQPDRVQMYRLTTVQYYLSAGGLKTRNVNGEFYSMWLYFASDLVKVQEDFD